MDSHLHDGRVAHQARKIGHPTGPTSAAHVTHQARQRAHIGHSTTRSSTGAGTPGGDIRVLVTLVILGAGLLGLDRGLREGLLHVGVGWVEGEALGVGLDGFRVVAERVVGVARGEWGLVLSY